MHGLDALLMMLIQRFPAQGNQTGFHAAPMNDDCRTRMVAQQAHFLVGRDEDSVQAADSTLTRTPIPRTSGQ